MKQEKRIPIAMEKGQCPICGVVHDTNVLLGKDFMSDAAAEAKEDLIKRSPPTHYQYCSDCKENVDLGYIGLIEFDELLTVDKVPYRTGNLMWMREHVFIDIFDKTALNKAVKNRAAYVTQEVFGMLKEMHENSESSAESEDNT